MHVDAAMPKTSLSLAAFKDRHRGEIILVCGCGESLNSFDSADRFVTIGVNDVGRRFQPDYLVVVNPRRQFTADRFKYVAASKAGHVFTQLPDSGIPHPRIVRFRLGRYGGTDFTDPGVLHYTQNSPYVALCLAAHMGARRIGLIGVDFSDHHFFARTGAHPLARNLQAIDAEYRRLAQALRVRDIEVFNLSPQSRLTAFPRTTIDEFASGTATAFAPVLPGEPSGTRGPVQGGRAMTVAISGSREGVIGDLLNALADSAARLGHSVFRDLASVRHDRSAVAIVWNGRSHTYRGPTLYCEHGWLPRWAYQISAKGINADSHIAPFVWDEESLTPQQDDALDRHLAAIRERIAGEHAPGANGASGIDGLPPAFLLVPLQVEWDTNIVRHVPPRYRRMQALIDAIALADPPLPVLFKQHPADARRGHQHLRLRPKRPQDRVQPHSAADIHQLLGSGCCRGIITLNSNVAHDGLIWDVPAVVLGSNVWPREGIGPFLTGLPERWDALFEMLQDPRIRVCRRAYAHYLMQNQWTIEDARDPRRVQELLHSALGPTRAVKPVARAVRASLPVINVVAANRGWLFEDFKSHFSAVSGKSATVVATEQPRRDADAWIFIRTHEAAQTPDPMRTIVQIHDMFDDGLYLPSGRRHCVAACAAAVLTHPGQREILARSKIDLAAKGVMERPIGALGSLVPRARLARQFTVGWIGRPAVHHGVDIKRVGWFIEALRAAGGPVEAVLVGERLEAAHALLRRHRIRSRYLRKHALTLKDLANVYQGLDGVVITSAMEAGPLSLFEALAAGVPVISTPVGWASQLIRNGDNGFLVNTVGEMAAAIRALREERTAWFERRSAIRASLGGHTLEGWVEANIDLALQLVNRNRGAADAAIPDTAVSG